MSENIQTISDIQITVEGAPESCTTVVSSLITDALSTAGFTNVTQVLHNGEPCVDYPTDAVLSSIALTQPTLLATPVTVQEKVDRDDFDDDNRIDSVTFIKTSDGPDDEDDADNALVAELENAAIAAEY